MRIQISHETVYRYEEPARGVIQTLRLTPRNHDGQYVESWRIDVSENCQLAQHEDAFGNITHVFSAEGPLSELRVLVEGEVEVGLGYLLEIRLDEFFRLIGMLLTQVHRPGHGAHRGQHDWPFRLDGFAAGGDHLIRHVLILGQVALHRIGDHGADAAADRDIGERRHEGEPVGAALLHRRDHRRADADRLQSDILIRIHAAHHHDRAHELIGARPR